MLLAFHEMVYIYGRGAGLGSCSVLPHSSLWLLTLWAVGGKMEGGLGLCTHHLGMCQLESWRRDSCKWHCQSLRIPRGNSCCVGARGKPGQRACCGTKAGKTGLNFPGDSVLPTYKNKGNSKSTQQSLNKCTLSCGLKLLKKLPSLPEINLQRSSV